MKFKYWTTTVTNSKGRLIKRPILELEITVSGGGSLKVLGLIDSGADMTTLNIQYAQALGIDLSKAKKKELIGIGKGRETVYESVFLFKIKHLGIEMEVPASYIDSPNVDILLGQEGFFDKLRIKFEKDHDTFEITPVAKR